MQVDNSSTVTFNNKRNSVRLQTNVRYGVGSVWIADMLHVPYGVRYDVYCAFFNSEFT